MGVQMYDFFYRIQTPPKVTRECRRVVHWARVRPTECRHIIQSNLEALPTLSPLEQLLHEIEVHCRPADLPDSVTNDISELEVGDSLRVSDLNFPEGVTTKMGGDVLAALVTQTRASVSEGAGGEAAAEGEEAAEGEGGEEGSKEAASE